MNNYELKLVDTNEPSNIYIYADRVDIYFDTNNLQTEKNCQNKLLVLCSDEDIKKGDCYMQCYEHLKGEQWIIRWAENGGGKADHIKKVIATNSPTLTPNCYFSEDRVKEFVECWNKYKEFPKFSIQRMVAFIPKNNEDSKVNLATINNQLQIKWLKKEVPKSFEERKELSYELQYKNLKERYDLLSEKYLKLNSDYLDKCKKEAPKQTNIEQELTPLAQLIEEIESLRSSKIYINPNNIINDCIVLCYAHLEEEKQMVIDAYKEGCQDNILDERTDKTRAEQYFNQNFK
jgi:hypothetical protein